jgi:Brp/Blh family beta-carotene 15,15'-monooxygenase
MTATVRPAAEADAVPEVLRRRLFTPTTAGFGALAAVFAVLDLAGATVPFAVQVVPFAASVLLFGLPHGALDHLVPARLDPRISRRRSVATVVVLYALVGGATSAIWLTAPAIGFALFIAITWFHWGQGDLWIDRALHEQPASRADAVLTLLVRGALPMLVPLIAHPADYAAVLASMVGVVDPGAATGLGALASLPVRAAAAAALLLVVAAHLLLRRHRGAPVGRAAAEIAVLAAFFVAVPSVLAVGLYFTFWHAVRHIVRLELLDPAGRAALAAGALRRGFLRFARDAWPVTLCAVALLVGVALAFRSAGLGTYLLLIAALTTPHTVVVTWMDRRQRPAQQATSRY